MTIRRRNFLSMMAALPFSTSVVRAEEWIHSGPDQQAESQDKNFYVWVHGAFGITWLKPTLGDPSPGLQLACPNLAGVGGNEHAYHIGRITKQADKPVGTKEIYKNDKAKKAFNFKGLSAQWTKPQPFDPGTPIRLTGKLKDNYDGYVYRLPYPKAVLPLRPFRVTVQSIPAGKLPQTEFGLPVVHVFAYQGIQASDVKVVSATNENEILWQNTADNHLHLFVEPAEAPQDSTKHKPGETLKALLDCYSGIQKFTVKGRDECLRLDNVSGFCDLKEQFNLFEWRTKVCQVVPDPPPVTATHTYKPAGCPQFWVWEG